MKRKALPESLEMEVQHTVMVFIDLLIAWVAFRSGLRKNGFTTPV